jgi:hypothetical protein
MEFHFHLIIDGWPTIPTISTKTLKWPKEKDKWNMSIDICHIDIPKRLTKSWRRAPGIQLSKLNTMIHGAGRPGSNLGHAQKGDKIKPIHGISFPSDN